MNLTVKTKTQRALRSTLATVVVLLGLPGIAHGAGLWDVYQIALARDAAYSVASFEYESARLNLPLAKTAFLPLISVQGSVKREQDSDDNEHRGSLNVDWKLLDFQSLRAYRQTELQVLGAGIRFEDARADLILRVAERYFGLLAAIDNREVARRQKASIRRQMDLASERLEVGLGTQTDLFDAQARLQQAVADVIAADNQIDNAVQALRQITASDFDALASLGEDAPLAPPVPQSPDAWVDKALANNRALAVEDLNLKVAAEEINKQRAARLPRLDIRLRRDWVDSVSTDPPDDDSSSAVATLNWTLFRGGAIHLLTKQAGFRFNAAERAREQLKRQIESDTISAYLAVVSGVSQVKALSEAIRAGVSALHAKEEGFRAGLTTNIDVLDAQRDLSSSRTDYLSARYDFILAALRLERAVGDLNEEDVKRFNAWLVK